MIWFLLETAFVHSHCDFCSCLWKGDPQRRSAMSSRGVCDRGVDEQDHSLRWRCSMRLWEVLKIQMCFRLEGRLRKEIHSWSRESGMQWRNLDTLGEERWWTSSRQKSSEQGWPRCYILTENSNFTIEAETRNGKAVFLICGGGREERTLERTELRDISEFGAHWLCQSQQCRFP